MEALYELWQTIYEVVKHPHEIHVIAAIGIPVSIGTIISAFRAGRKK